MSYSTKQFPKMMSFLPNIHMCVTLSPHMYSTPLCMHAWLKKDLVCASKTFVIQIITAHAERNSGALNIYQIYCSNRLSDYTQCFGSTSRYRAHTHVPAASWKIYQRTLQNIYKANMCKTTLNILHIVWALSIYFHWEITYGANISWNDFKRSWFAWILCVVTCTTKLKVCYDAVTVIYAHLFGSNLNANK